MSRVSRAAGGGVVALALYTVQIAANVVLVPVVLKLAGEKTLGAYAVIGQALLYLGLVELGFSAAVSRFLPAATGYSDGGRRFRDVLSTARTYWLITNAVFALLILVLAQVGDSVLRLEGSLGAAEQRALWLLAAFTLIRTPLAAYGVALRAKQNLAAANALAGTAPLTTLTLSLVFLHSGKGLAGLICARLIGDAVSDAGQALYFVRKFGLAGLVWGFPDRALLREMVGFGMKSLIASMGSFFLFYSDNLVVVRLMGPAAVAVYYSSYTPAATAWQAVLKAIVNIVPATSELVARNAWDRLQSAYLRMLRHGLICGVFLALGILAFHRHLVTVWAGRERYAGELMTASMAVYAPFVILGNLCAQLLTGAGYVGLLAWCSVVEGVVNLTAAVLLGMTIGLPGIMISKLVAGLCVAPFAYGRFVRLLGLTTRHAWSAAKPALIVSVAPLAVTVLFVVSPAAGWVTLAWRSLIYVGAWCLCWWHYGTMPEDRVLVQRVASRVGRWKPAC